MAHEDQLSVRGVGAAAAAATEFGFFVLVDVADALGDLVGVAVQMAETPCLVGRGQGQGEEGPRGGEEGARKVGEERGCCEAVA